MKDALPSAERAQIDETKVVGYLLNPAKSRGKAEFFLRFGFTVERWQQLRQALHQHAWHGCVTAVVESDYGTRYSLDGPLATPCGRRPTVRTVWIIEHGADRPRLITAYPL